MDTSDEHRSSKYLTTGEAARHLCLSQTILESWRSQRRGPAFHRFGRLVRYTIADLDEWATEQRELSAAG